MHNYSLSSNFSSSIQNPLCIELLILQVNALFLNVLAGWLLFPPYVGLKFWGVPSRKLYAIEKSLKSSKGKYPADSSSSDDSEFKPPKTKQPRYSMSPDVEIDIRDIKKSLSSVFKIDKTLKVSCALRVLLIDNFTCIVCHDIIEPPAIYTRCCKSILGCERCVDHWYESSKACPRCRAERGFTETSRVSQIDELLRAIKNLGQPSCKCASASGSQAQ